MAVSEAIVLDEAFIWEGRLRVLVKVFHIRVGWRRVEVEIVFLDVLAVVPLAVGQPEQAFLEDLIASVPQAKRETEKLAIVAKARQSILAPTVCARASLVVAEVVPRVSRLAVILAHGS